MNWQFIIAVLLLAVAVYYIIRSIKKSTDGECGDCEVGDIAKKRRHVK
jgi:hypothetical protein